ncbi:MAG: hypothetical protein Q8Q23_00185 [bacterium]|nr:hypothetical protein [bacterium]
MKHYYNFLTITSLAAALGGIIYYFYALNYATIILAAIVITYILIKKAKNGNRPALKIDDEEKTSLTGSNLILIAIYLILLSLNFVILFKFQTTASIISPWEVVPWYFFLTFTLLILVLVIIILKTKLLKITYFLLLASCFSLAFSVALIIYKIGYGFDPFIHQATENLIAQTGAVYPKPFYYLGQYSLVLFLNKIFFLPTLWIDKLLLPFLSAILLPAALFTALKSFRLKNKIALLSSLFILIFPFTNFIVTTPQNLANLFLILLILLSLQKEKNFLLLTSVALATFTIHPISGIPALIFIIFLIIGKKITNKKLLFTVCCSLFIVSAGALPAAFYINNKTSAIINNIDAGASAGWQLPKLFLNDTSSVWLNFIYLYGFNSGLIIFLLIIFGITLSLRGVRRRGSLHDSFSETSNFVIYYPYFLMSTALVASYFLMNFVDFSYLINYEQGNFSKRILIIAAYFALPFILTALVEFIQKLFQQKKFVIISFLIFFTLIITASLYSTYPRYDDYFNSRSFSTSLSDVKAVRWIEQNANDNNFIVLANQQVSAAALKEFGFKKYYQTNKGQLFYYPIPTGDALYQFYLKMVNEQADNPPQNSQAGQARKTALEAADLVGADTVYFVINDYWFGFEKILAEARIGADHVQSIADGKVFIFKYVK